MGRWSGKKVALLYGGRSSEREVSLNSGRGCAEALRSRGYDVTLIDVGLDVADQLKTSGSEVAFIALHGRFGEDGCIQGMLESLAIPYTGSGVLASAVAMDKVLTKPLFRANELLVADYRVFSREHCQRISARDLPFGLPAVVKPSTEGSSIGVHLVRTEAELAAACVDAAQYKGQIIIEQYIAGREMQVAVLEGSALGAIEIVPANEFYDYAAKYTAGTTQYFYPARLPLEEREQLCRAGEAAYRALGCAGMARVDFIVTPKSEFYLLEVNTLPGMTESSLAPKIAAGNGISYSDLCERILDGASLKA